MEDILFDGVFYEKKESKNRYLKGNRTIDVSPSNVKVQLPDDAEYWLYCEGCKNLKIQNEKIKDFNGVQLKAYKSV